MIIWILLDIMVSLLVRIAIIHASVASVNIENATLKKASVIALISQAVSLIFGEHLLLGAVVVTAIIMVLIRFVYLTTPVKALVASIFYFVTRCLIWVFLSLANLAFSNISLP